MLIEYITWNNRWIIIMFGFLEKSQFQQCSVVTLVTAQFQPFSQFLSFGAVSES